MNSWAQFSSVLQHRNPNSFHVYSLIGSGMLLPCPCTGVRLSCPMTFVISLSIKCIPKYWWIVQCKRAGCQGPTVAHPSTLIAPGSTVLDPPSQSLFFNVPRLLWYKTPRIPQIHYELYKPPLFRLARPGSKRWWSLDPIQTVSEFTAINDCVCAAFILGSGLGWGIGRYL